VNTIEVLLTEIRSCFTEFCVQGIHIRTRESCRGCALLLCFWESPGRRLMRSSRQGTPLPERRKCGYRMPSWHHPRMTMLWNLLERSSCACKCCSLMQLQLSPRPSALLTISPLYSWRDLKVSARLHTRVRILFRSELPIRSCLFAKSSLRATF
jgi:hypothetical protein